MAEADPEAVARLKGQLRELFADHPFVSLSSLPTLYQQTYGKKLSPDEYGVTGDFSLTRLLRRMHEVVAVAPAMDPFKGAIVLPIPESGGPIVRLEDLPEPAEGEADISNGYGEDEDPQWVKLQEYRATQMLTEVVHQARSFVILTMPAASLNRNWSCS